MRHRRAKATETMTSRRPAAVRQGRRGGRGLTALEPRDQALKAGLVRLRRDGRVRVLGAIVLALGDPLAARRAANRAHPGPRCVVKAAAVVDLQQRLAAERVGDDLAARARYRSSSSLWSFRVAATAARARPISTSLAMASAYPSACPGKQSRPRGYASGERCVRALTLAPRSFCRACGRVTVASDEQAPADRPVPAPARGRSTRAGPRRAVGPLRAAGGAHPDRRQGRPVGLPVLRGRLRPEGVRQGREGHPDRGRSRLADLPRAGCARRARPPRSSSTRRCARPRSSTAARAAPSGRTSASSRRPT